MLFGYVKIEPDTIVGRSGPGPGRSRPESIGTQTEVDTANQAVQAAPFTLNHRTQTTFNLSSFGAETLDSAVQTDPTRERIEPHSTAVQAVQLAVANPSLGRGFLRRTLARAFRETGGPLNPMERFVIDTVMESVFAMERSYTERLLHNLGLLAANPQFAIQLAAAEFAQRLNRLD